jgi:NAD(P)-dependent dehydrogenase (short-subunit alcohol dehydrogenase family)
MPPLAVVTGANRGLGLEVVRQLAARGYDVVLGARDLERGRDAAAGLDVAVRQLDVTDPSSLERLELERCDVLVNNAAIHYDTWQRAPGADLRVVEEALQANLLGAWRMVEAVLGLLRRSPHGRIVNVSSGAGSITTMGSGPPAYSVSKAALNALTRLLAADLRGDGILVNSVCPGWVATDMGGAGGRPVEEGAAGIVWAATLPDDGPTGGFFRDGRPIPW